MRERERLTTDQAAGRLGISVDAVRGRIKRGTLEHEREGNKVYVLLDTSQSATSPDESTTNRDQSTDQSTDQPGDQREATRPDELVEVLAGQVEHLREQLSEEREARRRADTIIMQLSQANAEQARTIRAIEAPDSPQYSAGDEQNEGQEPQSPDPQGSTTPQTTEGNIEGPRRGLWQRFADRIFGG